MSERPDALAALEQGDVVSARDYTVDEIDLFLFSAACWLPHRIHYDKDWARQEGHEAVPVHGPLQASWAIQLVADWAAGQGGTLRSSSVRHVTPAYPRETLHVSAAVQRVGAVPAGREVALELRIAKDDGSLTTTGAATVFFEARNGAASGAGSR